MQTPGLIEGNQVGIAVEIMTLINASPEFASLNNPAPCKFSFDLARHVVLFQLLCWSCDYLLAWSLKGAEECTKYAHSAHSLADPADLTERPVPLLPDLLVVMPATSLRSLAFSLFKLSTVDSILASLFSKDSASFPLGPFSD